MPRADPCAVSTASAGFRGRDPEGDGHIPGIAPGQLDWSDGDVAVFLRTGLTPDYDSAGGSMVDLIEDFGVLSDDDIAAIAAYLRGVPAAEEAG